MGLKGATMEAFPIFVFIFIFVFVPGIRRRRR